MLNQECAISFTVEDTNNILPLICALARGGSELMIWVVFLVWWSQGKRFIKPLRSVVYIQSVLWNVKHTSRKVIIENINPSIWTYLYYRVPTLLKWGNSRIIKGSTVHLQGYFGIIVVTLVCVNKNSSNFSHLFQYVLGLCSTLKKVSIIFLKNGWWKNSVEFREKKNISVDLFVVFHKFQGVSRFLLKIPGYFQGSRSQTKFQAFQGAVVTLLLAPYVR